MGNWQPNWGRLDVKVVCMACSWEVSGANIQEMHEAGLTTLTSLMPGKVTVRYCSLPTYGIGTQTYGLIVASMTAAA